MTRMACPKNSSAAVASWGSIRASRSAARHVRDRLDEAQEARGLFLIDALSPKIADKRAQGSAARDVLRFVACGSVAAGKQTLRHARIAALLGIKEVLLVVNKMDLVGFEEAAFLAIREEFRGFAKPLGISAAAVPTVAPDGDNVVESSARTPWYVGPTVLQWLETVEAAPPQRGPLRFLVQGVS